MEAFTPQLRDTALAGHANRVELRGSPRRLAWPPLCPACSAPAEERVEVRKVFVRPARGRSRARYRIASARIPFCAACAARHRTLSEAMAPNAWALRSVHPGAVITAVCAAAFAVVSYRYAYAAAPPAFVGSDFGLLLALRLLPVWLASLAVSTMLLIAAKARRSRVPAQTEVTRACDFSDDLSLPWERAFRVWAVHDPRFFGAFVAANRASVISDAERAGREGHRSTVVTAIVITVASLMVAHLLGLFW